MNKSLWTSATTTLSLSPTVSTSSFNLLRFLFLYDNGDKMMAHTTYSSAAFLTDGGDHGGGHGGGAHVAISTDQTINKFIQSAASAAISVANKTVLMLSTLRPHELVYQNLVADNFDVVDSDSLSTSYDSTTDIPVVSTVMTLPPTVPANMTIITDLTDAYYGKVFNKLNYEYRSIHGYLSLVVCVFGIIANVLNIIVLTRKNMESPTNTILTGMAVSDLLVIASYIPYVIHNYIRTEVSPEQMYNYGWAVFTLFHAHNTVLFHTISIWLTVLLAVWRYVTVRTPLRTRSMLTIGRARLYILLVYLIVPVFCIPVFISFTIHPIDVSYEKRNVSIYKVDIVQIDGRNHYILEKIQFWVFSVFLKLIPCGLLTCITLALIRILIEARKRKERLLKGNIGSSSGGRSGPNNYNVPVLTTTHQNDSPRQTPPTNKKQKLQQESTSANINNTGNNSGHIYLEVDTPPTDYDDDDEESTSSNEKVSNRGQETFTNGCLKLCLHWREQNNNEHSQHSKQPVNNAHGCCCSLIRTAPGFIFRKFQHSNGSKNFQVNHHLQHQLSQQSQQQHCHHKPQEIKLKFRSNSHNISSSSSSSNPSGNSERTTRMLIAVLIMFLVCEFPSGILALLSGILGKIFFKNVYNNFGELMDMLALINSAVNFVLYCLMSQQFRKTFSQLFCIRWTEEISGQNGRAGSISVAQRSNQTLNVQHAKHANQMISQHPELTTTEYLATENSLLSKNPSRNNLMVSGDCIASAESTGNINSSNCNSIDNVSNNSQISINVCSAETASASISIPTTMIKNNLLVVTSNINKKNLKNETTIITKTTTMANTITTTTTTTTPPNIETNNATLTSTANISPTTNLITEISSNIDKNCSTSV